jgi:hypothetical protein
MFSTGRSLARVGDTSAALRQEGLALRQEGHVYSSNLTWHSPSVRRAMWAARREVDGTIAAERG